MSETTLNMADPSIVDGDSPLSSKCTGDGPCGNSSDYECSGYICGEEDGESNDDTYNWPPDTPFPDNEDKVPKKCKLPVKNFGTQNTDPKIQLDPEDISNQKTKPWNGNIKFRPEKPAVINTKL